MLFFVLLFPTIKKWTLFSSHYSFVCFPSFVCFEPVQPVPPQIFSSSPYGFFFTVSILITAFLFLSYLTPCSQSFLSHFSFSFFDIAFLKIMFFGHLTKLTVFLGFLEKALSWGSLCWALVSYTSHGIRSQSYVHQEPIRFKLQV